MIRKNILFGLDSNGPHVPNEGLFEDLEEKVFNNARRDVGRWPTLRTNTAIMLNIQSSNYLIDKTTHHMFQGY